MVESVCFCALVGLWRRVSPWLARMVSRVLELGLRVMCEYS